MNKILLIDKPIGWTSFDVVAKIRGVARKISGDKKIKVGHAGTLDPFATGLLIVLVGKENTAKQDSFMKQDKEYLATLKLGFTSTTGDPEGEIALFASMSSLVTNPGISLELSDPSSEALAKFEGDPRVRKDDKLSKGKIEKALAGFLGEISQIPPIYSAIKVDGKRAYKLAREGKKVEMKPRKVHIYELEIIEYEYPELKIRVKCSSGTYIRTLAEDIGKALGCGAYLTGLQRTKIGDSRIQDSLIIEDAVKLLDQT